MLGSDRPQHRLHYLPMHIRQSEMPPLEFERQFGVVDPKQMQHRRLKVVDVYRVFRHIHRQFVRFAIGEAWLHAATRHPQREGVRMMIVTPFGTIVNIALNERRAAKLASPNHQRVVEQSVLSGPSPGRRKLDRCHGIGCIAPW